MSRAYDTVKKYGGKYIVRSKDVKPFAGDWAPEKVIIIGFKDKLSLQKWFNSPEYTEIMPLREKSTESRAIIAEGFY